MIKVGIVDDHEVLRQGMELLLSNKEGLKVVFTAANGEEGVKKCRIYKPDVVLMDIKMPKMNGVEAVKIIKSELQNIKIIILTTFNEDEYLFDSLRYGASGYLLKDATPDEIAEGINTVYNGGALIKPDTAVKLINKLNQVSNKSLKKDTDKKINQLTKREKDICKSVAQGKNNKEISEQLYLSEGTVKNHITVILNKLELRDRTQLAIYTLNNQIG